MLDEPLLHRREMRAHEFLRELRIALGDCLGDFLVRVRVASLVVDAVRGLAAMSPTAVRRHLQHRVEDCDHQRVARGDGEPAVELGVGLLVRIWIGCRPACLRRLEQLVEVGLRCA